MVQSILWQVLAQKKTPSDWLKFFDSQSEASIQCFFTLTLTTFGPQHVKGRVWKTVIENGVFFWYNFVSGHFCVLKEVRHIKMHCTSKLLFSDSSVFEEFLA